MLQITIPSTETYDEKTNTFETTKEYVLQLEHSLVSISKWESKWNKVFLSKEEKTYEEIIHYVKCMTITQNIPDKAYRCLTRENIEQINEYISAPMTATWFSKQAPAGINKEQTTSELIYYWMVALNIPFECQRWHLNRLLTLVRVCNIKNTPPKKMGKSALMRRNAALNAARKKQLNTTG